MAVGTTAAILGSAAIGAAGSAYAANKQGSATKKAIKAQNELVGPWSEAGLNALGPLQDFIGGGANFADTQAYKDIVNSARASGMNLSGNRLTALTDYYATNFRPQRLNELSLLPKLGQASAAGQAANIGNLYQSLGATQAGGILGAANSANNALNQFAFLSMLNQQNNPGTFNTSTRITG